MNKLSYWLSILAGISIPYVLNSPPTRAQISPDGTLQTQVNQSGKIFEITGGIQSGTNLFHSFKDFSVLTGNTAYFNNAANIQNIISRVTGTSISNIDGVIKTNSTANLFLINPNGIIFGNQAQLNIGGSFFATTANSLNFSDGTIFSATDTSTAPLLTMSVPLGVQWGTNTPQNITNSGNLSPGKDLTFAGGSISSTGILSAPQGNITLIAKNNITTENINSNGGNINLVAEGEIVPNGIIKSLGNINGGDITLNATGNITATSPNFLISSEGKENVGGNINIKSAGIISINNGNINTITNGIGIGGDINLTGKSVVITNGVRVQNSTLGNNGIGQGGNITVSTTDTNNGTIELSGGNTTNRGGLYTITTGNAGKSGDVTINTNNLIIQNLAVASTSTDINSHGNGGNLSINATDSVILNNQSGLYTNAYGQGNGGDLNIKTKQLLVSNNSGITSNTYSSGQGGNISINASDAVELIGTVPGAFTPTPQASRILNDLIAQQIPQFTALGTISTAEGKAGNLTIKTGNLSIKNGAGVITSTVSTNANAGSGGLLQVTASGSVEIIGFAGLISSTFGSGNAGGLNLSAGNLTVKDGGGISADTLGAGKAGNLILNVDELTVQNGSRIGAGSFGTTTTGIGGILQINATDAVKISGKSADNQVTSGLFVNSQGTGNAGELSLTAKQLILENGGQITASTLGKGNGGNININTSDIVELNNQSQLSSNSYSTGNAGNLNIQTKQLLVSNNSIITSSIFSSGQGGNLSINASNSVELMGTNSQSFTPTIQVSQIINNLLSQSTPQMSGLETVSAGTGNAGNLTIKTGNLTIKNGAGVITSTISKNANAGKGGKLQILASGGVEITGFGGLISSTFGSGNAGGLDLSAVNLIVQNGGVISTDTLGAGKAGNLILNVDELTVQNGSRIGAGSFGNTTTGAGGILKINATNSVNIIGKSVDNQLPSGLFVNTEGTGNAGQLSLTAKQLILENGGQITASTFGNGNGGDLLINVTDAVKLNNQSYISSNTYNSGNAGELNIKTKQLVVNNNSGITSNTYSSGQGGNISIDASDSVELIGNKPGAFNPVSQFSKITHELVAETLPQFSILTAFTEGAGNAGNLMIKTGNFSIKNGAGVVTSTIAANSGQGGKLTVVASGIVEIIGFSALVSSTFGSGNAGVLEVSSGKLRLEDGGGISADTFANGNAGNLILNTGELTLQNGSIIDAGSLNTLSTGNGGILMINASNYIQISGKSADGKFASGLFVNTESAGNAGSIFVNTKSFEIGNNAVLSAKTTGSGNGGSITVNSNTFTAVNGGQLITTTLGSGDAGSIIIKAKDMFRLDGNNTGLFASTIANSTGKSGSINIDPQQVIITNGAGVTVDSQGNGNGGNLQIQSGNIILNNNAFLSAATASGEGGNINLQIQDFLLMRNNSLISATAGGTGNGGNLIINAPFLLSVATENNDIIANAFKGKGGNIFINTQGIFGQEFRSLLTPKSDITASSEFGVNGTVQINSPGIDPSQGLTDLPSTTVDLSGLVAASCREQNTPEQSAFIITGRGGLPSNPTEALESEIVLPDISTTFKQPDYQLSINHYPLSINQIIEAQGWIINQKGQIVLTAQATNLTSHQPWKKPISCN